jgi:voltage-gated potassium channel
MFSINSRLHQLLFALSLFLSGGAIGIIGYHLIEGYSWLDAFYMTIITASTVGFREVSPLSDEGKLFTSLFIMFNLGTFTYFISIFSKYVFEGELKEIFWAYRNSLDMKKLKDHVIVCGYGRYGVRAVEELKENGEKFVIIETDEDTINKLGLSDDEKANILIGDANDEHILQKAGIDRAKALIAALPEDASNVFVTLSAREFNSEMTIIARASLESSKKKLLTAGANHVILPDLIGGHFMASLVTRPQVMGFLERIAGWTEDKILLEEVKYEDLYDEYKDKTIGEIHIHSRFNVTVVGYKDEGERYSFNPDASLKIIANGVIIVLGDPISIAGFKENCTHS